VSRLPRRAAFACLLSLPLLSLATPLPAGAAACLTLTSPGGAWKVFWHTVGRRAFDDDTERLERHLARFGARRVIHGHTPHRGDRPSARHEGRLWGFDGCFSRYWNRDGSGAGPVGATVALLPALDGAAPAERPAGRDPRESAT